MREPPCYLVRVRIRLHNDSRFCHCRRCPSSLFRKFAALHLSVEILGSMAAFITTFCWLPQILKILREKKAGDISLLTTGALASGMFLWLLYGVLIGSWPLIAANVVSFLFIVTIVGLKLRYG